MVMYSYSYNVPIYVTIFLFQTLFLAICINIQGTNFTVAPPLRHGNSYMHSEHVSLQSRQPFPTLPAKLNLK